MAKKKETRGGWNKKYTTEKQKKKAFYEQTAKWNKNHTRCINVRFNAATDKDILERLDQVENKTDYIRKLIQQDIENNK